MNADRYHFKLIGFFIFLLYIYSVAVHEFSVVSTAENAVTGGYATLRPNRSVVVSK